MKFTARIFAAGLVFWLTSVLAHAGIVPVRNPEFETPVTGGWDNTVTDWVKSGAVTDSFVERIEVLPVAGNQPAVYFAGRGFNHVGLANQSAIWQDLADGPVAGKRYSLVVSIGNRAGATSAGNGSIFKLQQVVGASVTDLSTRVVGADAIPAGQFRSYNTTWQAGATVPAGAKFRIRLECASSDRAHFDGVYLQSYDPVTPPGNYTPHPQTPPWAQETPPLLDSRAAGTTILYLDFDGEVLEPMPEWGFGETLTLAPCGYTVEEMQRIWEMIKEDYLPFDINVTTDAAKYWAARPGRRMRCIVTPTDRWALEQSGDYPPTNLDGWARIGGLSLAGISEHRANPCFAFVNRWSLAGGNTTLTKTPNVVGMAAAHELGHTFNLRHDLTASQPYYLGNGPQVTAFPDASTKMWCPIMGANGLITQWDRGEYSGAANDGGPPLQDDIAIIAGAPNYTGFAPDDNTFEDAFTGQMISTGGDSISTSGIIGRTSVSEEDEDWWRITMVSDGVLDLSVVPSAPFTDFNPVRQMEKNLGIPNLCPRLDILRINGASVTTMASVSASGDVSLPDDTRREVTFHLAAWPLPEMKLKLADALRARVVQQLTAGTYAIRVKGTGVGSPASDGFSSYGSMGAYRLEGTIWHRPVIANAERFHVVETGTFFSKQLFAQGGSVTWSALGLPPGLTISNSGAVTGVPLVHGTYNAQVVATGTGGQGTANVTFYVSQLAALGEALDVTLPLTWQFDSLAGWFTQPATTFDGVDAVQAAKISAGQNASMETTLAGPGFLTFRWKFSAHTSLAYVAVSRNGAEQRRLQTDDGWHVETVALVTGPNVIRWTFAKQPGATATGGDTAWVDTMLPELDVNTLGHALDYPGLVVERAGAGYWFFRAEAFNQAYASNCVQSAPAGHGQFSEIFTDVTGPGTFTFKWAADCEPGNDYLVWFVGNTEQARLSGPLAAFATQTATLPAGTHRIRWRYTKNGGVSTGADAGWVDRVQWTPAQQPPVITNPAAVTWTVGSVVSWPVTATNSPASYGFAIVPPATTLPAGLAWSAADHLIVGIPQRAGTVNVTLSATNSGGTGQQNVAITVESAYAKWARDNGLSGANAAATADPDRDGRSNLLEQAFNLNPNVRESYVPVTVNPATKRLTATFTRVPAYPDLRYEVQVSDNPGSWTTIASSVNGGATTSSGAFSVSDAGGSAPVTVTVVDNAAWPAKTKRSMRIKITQQ